MIQTHLGPWMRIWFGICQDMRIFKKLRGMHPTAELDSVVFIILQSLNKKKIYKAKYLKTRRSVQPTQSQK